MSAVEGTLTPRDLELLYETVAIAHRAMEKGNHPFGCLLADEQGNIVMEGENTVTTEHNDCGHAETNLMRQASMKFDRDFLSRCSFYTSVEPCVMCSGSIYWANVKRVIFGVSEQQLLDLTGSNPENPTMSMPCRNVFNAGQKEVEVIGPIEDAAWREAALTDHRSFWG